MNAYATEAEERGLRTAEAGLTDSGRAESLAGGPAVAVTQGTGPAAAEVSDVLPAGPAMSKFTYPGGSKPLTGYTIKRGIGRGGFGEVYYALSDGGKEVALKLLRRNFDVELRGVVQCLNLKHPNLLGLYDIRTDERDDCWVVMEFASGASLEEVIAQHPGGMPPHEAVAWLKGIAAGVGYLHDCGIVHRDLKPANIFCDGGLVKIGDYGLSKFISCSRRSGQTESVGTVHYMAPEIANGRYGRGIDIYALGVVLHEMLTGRVPFEGESVGEVLMKHLTMTPDLSPIQQPYRDIVARALAKDPQQRFDTVAELVAAFPELPPGSVRGYDLPPVIVRAVAIPTPPAAPPAAAAVATRMQALPPAALPPTAIVQTVPHATLVQSDEGEPIIRWLRNSLRGLTTPAKVVMILAALFLLPHGLGQLAIVLGLGYCVYYCFWMLSRSTAVRRGAVIAAPPAVAAGRTMLATTQGAAPARRRRWHGRPLSALVVRTPRQRIAELCGSLVLSALVCLVMTVVVIMFRGQSTAPEQFAWLALVSILGSWGVLIPSKFWEGTHGEPVLRRFCMLIVGLGVGLAAFGLQQALSVSLPHEFSAKPAFYRQSWPPAAEVAAAVASPRSLMTYVSYFGFLFLLVRWWRLANPLRTARLGVWATAVCVTCSIGLYMFWPSSQQWDFFPQMWGFLVTGIIAVAVQLASPWQSAHAGRFAD